MSLANNFEQLPNAQVPPREARELPLDPLARIYIRLALAHFVVFFQAPALEVSKGEGLRRVDTILVYQHGSFADS